MHILLAKRIGLCALSGLGVGALQINDGWFDWLGATVFYAASGLLFAAGVLFPYLKRGDRVFIRALALVNASGASYYSAVWLALEGPFAGDHGWISFTIASVAGAAIVLIALVSVTPVRATAALASYGCVAAIIGGPITCATLPEETILTLAGHAAWHILICLAIWTAAKK